MGKYGKEFRKNQKNEWKEKYFNYKELKQMINNFSARETKKTLSSSSQLTLTIYPHQKLQEKKKEKKAANVATFISKLDSEIKRVFIFLPTKKKNYTKI